MKMIRRWRTKYRKVANFNSDDSASNNRLSPIFKVANLGKVGNLFLSGNFQKFIIAVCCYLFISCSSGKSNATGENIQTASALSATPPCIQTMIDSAKKQPAGMGITEVTRFVYNGAKVYLVAAPCCDQFNPLYDSACNLLFSPSGGITGKGDRSNPDFFTIAKQDSVIWKAQK